MYFENNFSIYTQVFKHPILGGKRTTWPHTTLLGMGKILFLKYYGCRELPDRSKILLQL